MVDRDLDTHTVTPTVEVPRKVIEELTESGVIDGPDDCRDRLYDRVEVRPEFVTPTGQLVREELTDGGE
jgi:hypothetical protein